ncbi:MAG: xanthine dehydrogenase small subunit [Alphaproteobacteria bacterium]
MPDPITFILNGKKTVVEGLSPTTTLLQYLRRNAGLPGTKEGCAEGDCGACTVAVGKLKDGKTDYQSINACIAFLPTLDGREVVTVEHLKRDCKMNPVQEQMVKCHGSQCGFCTPGFVMALSTLMNNTKNANDEDIQDAIAGNLCRCTGYRPILDAARVANKDTNRALPSEPKTLATIQRNKMFSYEAEGKKFFAPVTVAELADIYAQYPAATILAGGTDVGLWVTKFHMELPVVIYTGNVAELRQIKETAEGLEIGGAATYTEAFAALAAFDPSMENLLKRFASVHIRNAGTVGGNIANGSPIGDGPPPLIVLKTKLVLRSKSGSRTLNLEDFFIEYKKQDRKPGEFVEKIIVPKKPATVQFRVYKLSKRFDQDISAVCAAFALEIKDGKVAEARIAYGGMAGTPHRATNVEKALAGQPWNEDTLRAGMKALDSDYKPMSDMRASEAYRATIAKNLLHRFFFETTEPATPTQVYRYAE